MLDFCIVIITNVQLTSLITVYIYICMCVPSSDEAKTYQLCVGEGSEKRVVDGQRLKRFIRTAKLSRV